MRAVLRPWIRDRWGDDVRIIEELALGRRRIDLVVVGVNDIAGIEVKGPRDRLDARLTDQIHIFGYYMPELWLAVAPRWRDHDAYRFCGVNRAVVVDGQVVEEPRRRRASERFSAMGRGSQDPDALRDDLACGRLLELLWAGELERVAERTQVMLPLRDHSKARSCGLLARMLTGHEIVKQVCQELRARPLVGMASSPPIAKA